MAFSMSGMAGAVGGANPQARQADDLLDIQTEHLGFAAIAGRNTKTKITNKLKLLPSPWRADDLPAPQSQLFTTAPRRGVVAAAGPDCLVIASADSIRAALTSERDESNKDPVVAFSPELTIPQTRLSQIAFTSNEQYLVISAQQGGGLAIHEVSALLQKNTNSAFQLATQGVGVRALVPNPDPELSDHVAVVLEKGQLMIANLKQKDFVKTQNGAVLKDNVTCVTWSNKGKQLVAGLADGTVLQMKPDGSPQALIPRPPALEGDQFVATISWLTNDDFFIVHAPASVEPGSPPEMTYHIVQREKATQNYTFSKFILGACDGFGEIRNSPPHYFISRLRSWKPSLDELVMVLSTGGMELGLITKSSQPLSRETPVTNTYIPTVMADDARKAAMPSTVDEDAYPEMPDSSPLGLALDLSSKEKVYKPIGGSDIEWSKTPLPAIMALNQEGYLNAWWIVYNDSIEAGIAYEGLAAAGGAQPSLQQSQSSGPATSSPFGKAAGGAFGQPAFGRSTSGFGASSPMGQSKSPWASASTGGAPAFGQPAFGSTPKAASPAFGKPASPAFGKPSSPAFGKPSFGAPSQPGTGSAFGSSGGVGQKPSPWASQPTSTPTKTGGAFGGTPSGESGFAKFGQQNNASPFASAAKPGQTSTFGGLAASKPPGQSVFGSGGSSFGQASTPNQSFGLKTEPSFGSTVSLNSTTGGSTIKSPSFGTPTQPSVFGQQKPAEQPRTQESDMGDADDQTATPKEAAKPNPFGLGASGFKLDSGFKGDGTAKDDLPKTEAASSFGSFGLGSSFGQALGEAQKTEQESEEKTPSKTGSSLFGSADKKEPEATAMTAPKDAPKTSGLFGSSKPADHGSSLFGKSEKVKSPAPEEPKEESKHEAAPLPPDFTKKTPKKDDFQAEDAPLPPDFALPKAGADEKDEDDLPPIAGSPPIKVEKPDSPSLSEIPEKRDEERAPAPPPSAPANNTWAFPPVEKTRSDSRSRSIAQPTSRSPSRSPVRSPSRNPFSMSTTPAGVPKHTAPAPVFPPPMTARRDEQLRSPSPVRTASISTPRRQAVTIPPPAPTTRATSRPSESLEQDPVFRDLGDDQEFEATRAILSSSPHAKKTLEEFYVHQDYAGRSGPSSVPGSIEQLYRDMQSMIDTVGLNAHHLAGFVKGHNEITHEGRSRDDLDVDVEDPEENDWVLAEIEDLSKVENGLQRSLDTGRVADVQNKIRDLIRLSKDVGQLRRRLNDVRKSIEQRRDPSKLAVTRATPLSEEQGAQQTQLRSSFAHTQKLLAEAEEGIVLLKTRVSSAQSTKTGGVPGSAGSASHTPTAEAVENTIKKMTAMVEQKSGDLDVLENQLNKLRLIGGDDENFPNGDGAAEDDEDYDDDDIAAGLTAMSLRSSGGRYSREASPAVFATPPSTRRGGYRSRDGTPGGGGSATRRLFFTPDRLGASPSPGLMRGSVGPGGREELVLRSVEDAAFGGEHLVGREEVRVYVRKMGKKKVVKANMREAVAKRGPRVTRVAGGQ